MDKQIILDEIKRLKKLINNENREEVEIKIQMLQNELRKC